MSAIRTEGIDRVMMLTLEQTRMSVIWSESIGSRDDVGVRGDALECNLEDVRVTNNGTSRHDDV